MTIAYRLTLVSLLVSALSACGGNGSSAPVAPAPSPSASGAETAEDSSCVTTAAGVKDDPHSIGCVASIVKSLAFKVRNANTNEVMDAVCTVQIASNGDISLSIPEFPGNFSLPNSAPQHHTHLTSEDAADTMRLRVWSGASTYNEGTGPYVEFYGPPQSDKLEVMALPYKASDGSDYIVKCVADLPTN